MQIIHDPQRQTLSLVPRPTLAATDGLHHRYGLVTCLTKLVLSIVSLSMVLRPGDFKRTIRMQVLRDVRVLHSNMVIVFHYWNVIL